MRNPLFFIICFLPLSRLAAEQIPEEVAAGLVADEFAKRVAAEEALYVWGKNNGEGALASIAKAARTSDEPEIRERSISALRKLSDEEYMSGGTGYLGIRMNEGVFLAPEDKIAIRVSVVEEGTPADKAGLEAGDGILGLNGKAWKGLGATGELSNTIKQMKPNEEALLLILREGRKPFELKVILGRRPMDDLRMASGQMADLDKLAQDRFFKEWLESHQLKIE